MLDLFCEHSVRCSEVLAAGQARASHSQQQLCYYSGSQLRLELPFLPFPDSLRGWTMVNFIFFAYLQLWDPRPPTLWKVYSLCAYLGYLPISIED